MPFNPVYDKYIAPGYRGLKRKRDSQEIVIGPTQPTKRRKIYEVPDDSPAWTVKLPRRITSKGELKGLDTDISMPAVLNTTNTNDNIVCLNLIQPGTGSWNRIGRKAHLKSVRLQGIVQTELGLTGGDWIGLVCRYLLVWDKQPSGNVLPSFDTIFGVTSQLGTETTTFTSPPKYDSMDRFVVLKDWSEEFNAEAFVIANNDTQLIKKKMDCYLPLPSLETVYSGQSNPMTIADVNSGALYFIARASNQLAGVANSAIIANARLRYVD